MVCQGDQSINGTDQQLVHQRETEIILATREGKGTEESSRGQWQSIKWEQTQQQPLQSQRTGFQQLRVKIDAKECWKVGEPRELHN